MDKKSKVLLAIFVMVIIAAVAATYYRTIIVRDYTLTNQTGVTTP